MNILLDNDQELIQLQGGEPTSRSCANNGKYVVSKENNLGPGKKIKCISGLKGPIFILQSASNLH